ncbi:MAG TPA: proline--tRNA ligase [Firmicutes bacterium]|nr:proline--tRNA ligase [Bacillota bacterium]
MAEIQNKSIVSRDEDFAEWYTSIVKKADLVDYSSMKGSMIIRPYGYAIWENIVSVLDAEFKRLGHENVQMPMFIPESLLNIEKDHVEGFSPEAAWVTYGGKEELEERVCVRPTSEVLFCEHYKKIIKSYRDLPKLYNQWCTIVRWEKTTRPFLRSREILWQEGHTMHATSEEAIEETKRMLKVYEDFQRNYLALPVLVGEKTDKEKFAGAEKTYTVEAMMYDGVALQNGTSHYFGSHFAKAFGIEFLNKENKLETPYQTSWGVTTRMIGSIIMTHGDDRGLVLPPKIAPTKVIIIPIGKDNDEVEHVIDSIVSELESMKISCKVDKSDKTPGYKFAEAEVKGYPIRLEIGPRDIEADKVTLVRRDTLEKESVSIEEVAIKIESLLEAIQKDMYDRALKRRDSMIYFANDYEEMKRIAKEKAGFIKINWCGNVACENKIKDDIGLKSRCIPLEHSEPTGVCAVCGKEGKCQIYFGKQY